MNPYIYNCSLLAGLAMVGIGAGLVNVPLALASVGGLVILLTLHAAR